MRRIVRIAFVLMATLLLHIALARLIRPGMALPCNLFLVVSVFYAGSSTRFQATLLGALLGLLSDAISPHGIGPEAFALCLASYLASGVNSVVIITAGAARLIAVFGASLVAKGTLVALALLMQRDLGGLTVHSCLVESAMNTLVAVPGFTLLLWWHRLDGVAYGAS